MSRQKGKREIEGMQWFSLCLPRIGIRIKGEHFLAPYHHIIWFHASRTEVATCLPLAFSLSFNFTEASMLMLSFLALAFSEEKSIKKKSQKSKQF